MPADASQLPRLLKRLHRFRRDARGGGLARLWRRRRKAALIAALRRDWPGGYTLTDHGEFAFVPAPLDRRGEHILFYGFDLPAPVLRFAPRGGVAIDIGANLGEWAVPLASAVGPSGRVLCCEPNPGVAAALTATLVINNLSQAAVLPVAVSDSDGEARLAIDAIDSGRSRLADAGVAVPLRTLDSIVAEARLTRLDLVKIDVEGHEARVLAGGERTLRLLRPAVIFESGHEAAGERERIADQLDACGYEIIAVLHHYGALACTVADYRAASGSCAGAEARNILTLPPGFKP